MATLWVGLSDREAAIADAGRKPWAPLATVGVAPNGKGGARLWPMLTAAYSAPHAPQRPQAPWAVALLHVHDTAPWVGDAERVIAWAWLER